MTSLRAFRRLLLPGLVLAVGVASTVVATPATGAWKTVFYKRGFVGKYNLAWAGAKPDEGSWLRLPVMIPVDGTQVRAWLRSDRDVELTLDQLTLAPGSDRQGGTDGRFFPVTFGGVRSVTIAAKKADFASDGSPAPIRAGLWYLQPYYAGGQPPYAYDADGLFRAGSADQKTIAADAYRKGSYAGNVYRLDVFTTDPRPVIACYGDSITQGVGSSAGSGNRYPELLGRALKRPVINLGVNGDLAKFARGMPALVGTLDGVDTVVFLMGINDIISGSLTAATYYIQNLTSVVSGVKAGGRKIYLGTILPAGGYAKFDAAPEKEKLRQQLNDWIRARSGATGVIDYDAALRDPATPSRLRADCQSDWLHPNDAGYQRMAEAAATVLR